jgi:ribosomal protein S18 acetylase RimI-like enzyme
MIAKSDIRIEEIGPHHHQEIMALVGQLPQWFDEKARQKYIRIDIGLHRGTVALLNDQLVGFVTYTSKYGAARISWIGVDPNYHRQGIGRQLLHSAERVLSSFGVHRVIVETVGWSDPEYIPYEKTRAFYKAMGYSVSKNLEVGQDAGYKWQMCEYSKDLVSKDLVDKDRVNKDRK